MPEKATNVCLDPSFAQARASCSISANCALSASRRPAPARGSNLTLGGPSARLSGTEDLSGRGPCAWDALGGARLRCLRLRRLPKGRLKGPAGQGFAHTLAEVEPVLAALGCGGRLCPDSGIATLPAAPKKASVLVL